MTLEEELEIFKTTKRSKLPDIIKHSLGIMARFCPSCGDFVQDKRFKRVCYGSPVWCRNFSDTGITLECRCGLRWHFTWKTFVNVLKNKLKIEPQEQMQWKLKEFIWAITVYFGLNEKETLDKIQAKLDRIKAKRG